jgi:hypothetical protein
VFLLYIDTASYFFYYFSPLLGAIVVSTKKQIVLIPYWVAETLKRNQLPIADCLDISKLRKVMSINDLVLFMALQNSIRNLTSAEVSCNILMAWLNHANAKSEEIKTEINTIVAMSGAPEFTDQLNNRLFTIDSKLNDYETPFNIYDLTPDYSGVVVYPGFFVNNGDTRLETVFIEAVLAALYVYDSYDIVSQTQYFKRYLELLSNN